MTRVTNTPAPRVRYHLLDALRGVAILLMIGYHTAWDLIYIFGVQSDLLVSPLGTVWQRCAAWTFILLSGFCWSMGKRPLRDGALCFGFGALMTVITLAIMPQNRVLFGVLTLLGSCMLLMIPLERLLRHVPAVVGLLGACVLFCFTLGINAAALGFGEWRMFTLPSWLYANHFTAYFGFPHSGFYSTDYFSVIPWFFLFCMGYFAYRTARKYCPEQGRFWRVLQQPIPLLSAMGRHSLVIYLFHQPVIYGTLWVYFALR